MTLQEALAHGRQTLAASPHLAEHAALDVDLLLLHHLGLTRAQRLAHPQHPLTAPEELAFRHSLTRRLRSEPIQYILGRQEFYGLAFHLTPAVLIPRPETEHLVEAVLKRLPGDRPLHLLDVGTGSGILAVTLATHLPHAQITAVDLSAAALEVARRNARTHSVEDRIDFFQSDLLQAVPDRRFHAIVSNPPYLSLADRAALHPQVREFEPEMALFAGPDGLAIYRRLIPQAHAALLPEGLLALEIGFGQRPALHHLLADWQHLHFEDDLQNIPRVALATRTLYP